MENRRRSGIRELHPSSPSMGVREFNRYMKKTEKQKRRNRRYKRHSPFRASVVSSVGLGLLLAAGLPFLAIQSDGTQQGGEGKHPSISSASPHPSQKESHHPHKRTTEHAKPYRTESQVTIYDNGASHNTDIGSITIIRGKNNKSI